MATTKRPNRATEEEFRNNLLASCVTVIRDQSLSTADLVPENQRAPEYSPHRNSLDNARAILDARSKVAAVAEAPQPAIPVQKAPEKRSVYGFGSLFSWKPSAAKPKDQGLGVAPDARPRFKGPTGSQGG